MTCQEWEEAIALLVDGEPAVAGLAEHLEDCNGCRQLFQDLREDQAALRATPAVDSAACEAVRDDLLRRVGRHSRTARWYAAAAAIAAGLTIAGIFVRMPGHPTKPMAGKPQPIIETPGHENVGTKADVAGSKARSTRLSKKRLRPAIPASAELALDSEWGRILSSPQIDTRPALRESRSEVAMRIQTSDPDVKILWLKEEVKGGSNE